MLISREGVWKWWRGGLVMDSSSDKLLCSFTTGHNILKNLRVKYPNDVLPFTQIEGAWKGKSNIKCSLYRVNRQFLSLFVHLLYFYVSSWSFMSLMVDMVPSRPLLDTSCLFLDIESNLLHSPHWIKGFETSK